MQLPSYEDSIGGRLPCYGPSRSVRCAVARFCPYIRPAPRYRFPRVEVENCPPVYYNAAVTALADPVMRAIRDLDALEQDEETEENIMARNRVIIEMAMACQQRLDAMYGPGERMIKVVLVGDEPAATGRDA